MGMKKKKQQLNVIEIEFFKNKNKLIWNKARHVCVDYLHM